MRDQYLLISKYLSGEASITEIDELNTWRHFNSVNEREYQELRESWVLANSEFTFIIPDKEKVWTGITRKMNWIKPVKTYTRSLFYRSISIAATIALIIGISLPHIFLKNEAEQFICFKTPSGQKAVVDLPDGTTVLLNSNSTLTYANSFSRTNRSVRVEGQAFFDVTNDPKHPFNVFVGSVKVLVHGTSFDVNGYTDNPQIEISLLSGLVSIISASSNQLLTKMSPNQKAIIPRSGEGKYTLVSCNANDESIWRLGKIKIDNEDLTSIINKMEQWYGVNIQLKGTSNTKRYWMTIKTESLKETLEIINRITPIDYSINGEEVAITYK